MRGQQNKKEAIVQNLQDAGCNEEIIKTFFELLDKKDIKKIMVLLDNYRSSIINEIHKNQKEIDVLDYLIYDIKKGNI